MPDEQVSTPVIPMGELREITLRIPGECFFCETVMLPEVPPKDPESKSSDKVSIWDNYLSELLNSEGFSPYPVDQLAWGYHLCELSKRAFIFATPLGRLRQLGWQNLELFRRVFPSFVSLFGKKYKSPIAIFLLSEETLTLGCFRSGSSVPDFLYSRSIDLEEADSLDKAKAILIGLVDLSKYQLLPDILTTQEVYRTDNHTFQFEHQWMNGEDPSLSLDQDVSMDADELWQHDLRGLPFKLVEKNRRRLERVRWNCLKVGASVALFLILGLVGLKITDSQLLAYSDRQKLMSTQVPLVLESQKLLEKLKQNQLGGIDPFGTIMRVASYRGGGDDDPHVWFSEAHFETRNHVKLEGEGRNVESINNFIEKLETNKIAVVRKDRSGDETRDIKSGGGSTSFKVEFEMFEEIQVQPSAANSSSPKNASNSK